jgi:FixJ family two-component response regulator
MNTDQSDVNVAGSWVYVVEDDPSVRDSLSLLLQLRGFSTATFDSAEAFLEGDSLERPACVLADVRLPGMSGLELQRKLANQQSALPFVVMTAHGDVATARAALRDGAVDFLEKPIDEQDLIEAITVALRSDHAQVEKARNREIAEEFGISQRTVEVHRARVMEKLQARRVADLFRLRFELDGAPAPAQAERVLS